MVTNVSVTAGTPDVWDRIKDFTFDRRVEFSASIDSASRDMDNRAAEIRARAQDASSKDRASAIKEYDDARADLKARRGDLDKATADTWADAKAKTAESWNKTKAAYDKVTKSDTAH